MASVPHAQLPDSSDIEASELDAQAGLPEDSRSTSRRRAVRWCVGSAAAVLTASAAVGSVASWSRGGGPGGAVARVSKFMVEQGTACTNQEAIYFSSLEGSLDSCVEQCSLDENCFGVMYNRKGTIGDSCSPAALPQSCMRYTGDCKAGSSSCWERVDVKATSGGYVVSGWRQGCSNWNTIQLGYTTLEVNEPSCAARCQDFPGCVGFGFQNLHTDQCSESGGFAAGACILWKGPCAREENACWTDHVMTSPKPTAYELKGAYAFCRNAQDIMLAQVPGPLPNEQACSAWCELTDGCTGYSFKRVSTCTSEPTFAPDCILWQGGCIPEANLCWDTYDGTSGSVDLEAMPLPISPAYDLPDHPRQCEDWKSNLLTAESTVEATIRACNAKCYTTWGCKGFSYLSGTCTLLGEVCAGSDLLLDTYEILWPSLTPWSEQRQATGCANWRDVLLGIPITDQTPYSCALKCKLTHGCTSFGFQPEVCADVTASMQKGACLLFGGQCDDADEPCWDHYIISIETDYALTTLPVTTTYTSVTHTTVTGADAARLNVPSTNLVAKYVAGQARVSVAHEVGILVGDTVTITAPGTAASENRTVVGFGTILGLKAILLDRPFDNSYPAGSIVQRDTGDDEVEETSVTDTSVTDTSLTTTTEMPTTTVPVTTETTVPVTTETTWTTTSTTSTTSTSTSTTSTTTTTKATTITFTTTSARLGEVIPVFINEMKHRTHGSSSIVGVEIAGPAGTDLSGWEVAIYDGGGNMLSGHTFALAEDITIPQQTMNPAGRQQFGTVWLQTPATNFAAAALIDSSGNLTQFLSIGSEVTAVDGPAELKSSEDISTALSTGDRDTAPTQAESYQRKGKGTTASDFPAWRITGSTYGQINRLQVFS